MSMAFFFYENYQKLNDLIAIILLLIYNNESISEEKSLKMDNAKHLSNGNF